MQGYLFVGVEVMHSDSPTGGDGVCAQRARDECFLLQLCMWTNTRTFFFFYRNRSGQKNQSVRNRSERQLFKVSSQAEKGLCSSINQI